MRRKAQVKSEQTIRTQRNVHTLLIFGVFDQLFFETASFMCIFGLRTSERHYLLVQTAEPCEENITLLYPDPDF